MWVVLSFLIFLFAFVRCEGEVGGFCPDLLGSLPGSHSGTRCEEDADCPNGKKCCSSIGNMDKECYNPQYGEKRGLCPATENMTEICYPVPVCEIDADCPDRKKCCFNGCGYDCHIPAHGAKKGLCPPDGSAIPVCMYPICGYDSDCPKAQKCCYNGCSIDCLDPVSGTKKGFCPAAENIPTNCAPENVCREDDDCSNKKKCCYNGCSNECHNPVYGEKKGTCPAAKTLVTVCHRELVCTADSDCPNTQKCCYNGCSNDCHDPVSGTKKGFCPAAENILTNCSPVPLCKRDEDCSNRKKCCFNGCGNDCHNPVKTKCESLGGVCKFKSSACCPKLEDSRRELCKKKGKTCCLPEKDIGGVCPIPKGFGTCVETCSSDYDCAADELCCSNGCGHACIKPDNPCASMRCNTCIITGPNCDARGSCSYGAKCVASGSENDAICPTPIGPGTCVDLCTADDDCTGGQMCCSNGCGRVCMDPVCNSKHQESLCKIADQYNLFGNTIYDPYVQVPEGCNNRSAISRGPECLDPERVCLKKPILKLLECSNKACSKDKTKLELVSLLNTNFNTTSPPRNLCDGNTVVFRKPKARSCSLKKLKNLCQDIGGVYEQPSGALEVYCTLP